MVDATVSSGWGSTSVAAGGAVSPDDADRKYSHASTADPSGRPHIGSGPNVLPPCSSQNTAAGFAMPTSLGASDEAGDAMSSASEPELLQLAATRIVAARAASLSRRVCLVVILRLSARCLSFLTNSAPTKFPCFAEMQMFDPPQDRVIATPFGVRFMETPTSLHPYPYGRTFFSNPTRGMVRNVARNSTHIPLASVAKAGGTRSRVELPISGERDVDSRL